MNTADFDYDLPPEYIAQTPIEPRDAARLLVLDRSSGKIAHAYFRELGQFLQPGDLLVLNETRVIPARLYARKVPGGGRVELLLLKRLDERQWEVMVGGHGLKVGRRFQVEAGPTGMVTGVFDGPRRVVQFDEPVEGYLASAGHVPLPPYIHVPLADPERYQTVYAHRSGSAAAPTAGLHFTPGLMASLQEAGIQLVTVTLHVGMDTFAPVTEADPQAHAIHTEWCQVSQAAAQSINLAHAAGRRIVAVGTTSVRTLETAGLKHTTESKTDRAIVRPFEGSTGLYILPGYSFQVVDALITNFHLPRSTLLMLVSAFAGRQRTLSAYEIAKQAGYRFYSFGDAMLIL
jgi:S-adenosylmethionine:tRNA ribosyltransferase-isomerase